MNTDFVVQFPQTNQLETELHELEVDTFEIEDIEDLGQNALSSSTCSSSSSSCSSCCHIKL